MDIDLTWDEDVAAWRAGEVGGYLVHIVPMLFNNHRVVLTPVNDTMVYDIGWCYGSKADAVRAVSAWDPTSGDRPAGFIKEVAMADTWDWVTAKLREEPQRVAD